MSAFANELTAIANPQVPTWGQMYNNLQTYRNFQAQQAQADAYRQAIDPTTGQLDPGKYNALLVSTPQGAWGAGAAMQQAGSAMAAQGTGRSDQFIAQQQRLNALSGMAAPLLLRAQEGQPVSTQDIMGVVQQGYNSGLLSAADVQRATATLNQPGADPREVLLGWQFTNMNAQEQLQQLQPTYRQYDPGTRTYFNVPPASMIGQPPGGAAPPGTPGAAPPAQGDVPWGTGFRTPQTGAGTATGTPAPPEGQGRNVGATGTGAPVTAAPMPPPAGGQGGGTGAPAPGFLPNGQPDPNYQGAPAQPATSPTTAPAGAPPRPTGAMSASDIGPPSTLVTAPQAPPGGVQAGPGIGEPEAWGRSVGAVTDLQQSASGSPNRQAALSYLASHLSGVDATNTGPGSEWAKQYSAWVNRAKDAGWLPNIAPGMTPEQVAGYEGFSKMAEQLREAQAAQIGGALTNDKFAAAVAATPGVGLSRLGNLGMVHVLQGNEDAINTKNNAWDGYKRQYGVNDTYYRQWELQYNKTAQADPRVNWVMHMSPPERATFLQGVQAEGQLPTLLADIRTAAQAGTINPMTANGDAAAIQAAVGAR